MSRLLVLLPSCAFAMIIASGGRLCAPTRASAALMSEDMPSIIVGGGRIGGALADMGCEGDVLVRRGEPIPAKPAEGPIYVCTRNDVLASVISATPPARRGDLVFMQNGMLGAFLTEQGLADTTQVLLYLAVSKLGEKPIDGITDTNPEGLTTATGKWASTFKARLASGGLTCKEVEGDSYARAMLEKHVWICAFMVVGARHGISVGEVEADHSNELRQLVDELVAAGEKKLDVTLEPGVFERLAAYGRSVSHFPTAVKEFEWRNGWFYQLTEAALAAGQPDPMPTHTAWLKELGVVS